MNLIKVLKNLSAVILSAVIAIGTINTGAANVQIFAAHNSGTGVKTSHIVSARGGMPTTGDVKVLAIKVGFQDYPISSDVLGESVYADEELFDMFNKQDDISTGQVGSSLHSYYSKSSYGLLNIHCDEIYEYTARYNRSAYDDEEEKLIKEALEALDGEIDYNDYDSDSDGYIDAIYLNFAGPQGEWDTTWWPHVNKSEGSRKFDGVKYHIYTFFHNSHDTSEDTQVLIHETGHLLGIPDYYSYDGKQNNLIGTFDMMAVNEGDHNGFSKWSYGWLDDENIWYVDRSDGNVVVNLTNIDSDDRTGRKIAVIAPENTKENGIFSQYFLIEYDSGDNLTKDVFEDYGLEPGFRIFYVNAVLDEDCTDYMKNDNYQLNDRLIYDVREVRQGDVVHFDTFYREGDEFTSETLPDSRFYSGKLGTPTGISITNFVTGENPSFRVSFTDIGDADIDNEVNWTGDTENLDNNLELVLYSDKIMDFADYAMRNAAYLLDSEGEQYELFVDDDEYDKYQYTFYCYSNELRQNTEYTLVIPEGTFIVAEGVYTDEMRISVKTGRFMELQLIDRTSVSLEMMSSNYIKMSERTLGRIEFLGDTGENKIAIRIKEIDLSGNRVAEHMAELPVVESQREEYLENPYMEADLIELYDGNMVLSVRYLGQNVFYKLDKSGNLLAEPQVVMTYVDAIAVGDIIKGRGVDALDNSDENVIISIDFENEPKMIYPDYDMMQLFAFDENNYIIEAWVEDAFLQLLVMDNNDEQISSITIEYVIDKLVPEEGNIRCIMLDEGEMLEIYSVLMDFNGNLIEEKNVTEALLDIRRNGETSNLIKLNVGYAFYVSCISDYGMFQYLYLLDDEFNITNKRVLSAGTEVLIYDDAVIVAFDDYDTWEDTLYACIFKAALSEKGNTDSGNENGENGGNKGNDINKENSGNKDSNKDNRETENGSGNAKDVRDFANGNVPGKQQEASQSSQQGGATDASGVKKSPKTGDIGYEFILLMFIASGGAVVFAKKLQGTND